MNGTRHTYYVVQSVSRLDDTYCLDEPMEAPNLEAAKRRAMHLAEEKHAVVAFSRTGDPVDGNWEDAEIIFQHGTIPDHLQDMLSE